MDDVLGCSLSLNQRFLSWPKTDFSYLKLISIATSSVSSKSRRMCEVPETSISRIVHAAIRLDSPRNTATEAIACTSKILMSMVGKKIKAFRSVVHARVEKNASLFKKSQSEKHLQTVKMRKKLKVFYALNFISLSLYMMADGRC